MTKTCFVVGPIGEEGTEARTRADALLKHIIKKVLEAPPFDMVVTRADEMEPGLITQQIIERVHNADLVVADLTDRNANALYELALRHVTRKPVVHMLLAGQKLPFDIADQRTIYYDTKDLDAAEVAKQNLKKHADAVLKNPEAVDNPIMAALTVVKLRDSATSTDQALARVLTEVAELREDLRTVKRVLAPSVEQGTTTYAAMNPGFGSSEEYKKLVQNIGQSLGYPYQAMNLGFGPSEEYKKLLQNIGQSLGNVKLTDALSNNIKLSNALTESMKVSGLLSDILRAPNPPPKCGICGQPIAGTPGRRSADNAPIHWEGKCPPPPEPSGGVPSTSAK